MHPEKSKKLIALVGPTATGKSDLAVAIAKKFNGEVVSADSRQIYRGMDLGSGKITKKEMRGVRHHLLSIASPARTKNFSVVKFKNLSDRKIVQIEKRGHLPILAGGTGFWIDAVAFNKNFPEVPPDHKLRARLAKLGTEQIFKKLLRLNPERAKIIDSKNRHRLIRAIELSKQLKQKSFEQSSEPSHDLLFIGVDLPNQILEKRIYDRLLKRLRLGMLKEVLGLHRSGVSWKRLESFGLEYKFCALYLQKKISKDQLTGQLSIAIRQYAKRQRTWFKRNKKINWLNSENKKDLLRRSFSLVKKFLKN